MVFVSVEATVDPSFRFVDLDGEPFAEQSAAETENTGPAWWVAVVPFGLAALVSWFIIRRLRRNRLPEIEGFTPKG